MNDASPNVEDANNSAGSIRQMQDDLSKLHSIDWKISKDNVTKYYLR